MDKEHLTGNFTHIALASSRQDLKLNRPGKKAADTDKIWKSIWINIRKAYLWGHNNKSFFSISFG